MSAKYDKLLEDHSKNVRKAFYWIRKSLPEILIDIPGVDYELRILLHDDTKTVPSQYEAYDNWVFGKRTAKVEEAYKYARLEHIQMNEHHWQHWIYIDSEAKLNVLDMPYECIIEMICDWWSFGWQQEDLYQIFDWYEANKKKIKLSKKTRQTVEEILDKLYEAIMRVRGPRK